MSSSELIEDCKHYANRAITRAEEVCWQNAIAQLTTLEQRVMELNIKLELEIENSNQLDLLTTILKKELAATRLSLGEKDEALNFITKWELPMSKCKDWTLVNKGEATEPIEYDCSYESAYGSKGAQDYIRKVAKEALSTTPNDLWQRVVDGLKAIASDSTTPIQDYEKAKELLTLLGATK